MNERKPQMSPEAQKPAGGLSQDLVDELMVLAQEVRAVEAKAARGWKISLAGWAVFLVVVFCYLYFGVYQRVVVPALEPKMIVELALGAANTALQKQGLPALDSSELAPAVAEKLKAQIPILVQERLRLQLVAWQERIPEYRIKYTEKFRDNAPKIVDQALDYLQTDMLPRIHTAALDFVGGKVDEVLKRIDETIGDAVQQVIAMHMESMEVVAPEQREELRKALALAFEEQMGPVLDELFKGTDDAMAEVTMQIDGLMDRQRTRSLTADDMLVIRLMQLSRALFTSMKQAPPEAQESILQQLLDQLRSVGVGESAREEIGRGFQAGVTPDFSRMPAEEREKAKAEYEKAMQMKRAAAGAAAAGAPTTPAIEIPAEAREKAEQARREAEKARSQAAAQAGQAAKEAQPVPPGPPPDTKKLEEEAKKKAAEAQAKAEQEAKAPAAAQ